MIWTIVTALATLASAIVYVVTVYYLRAQFKDAEKDRYLAVTNDLFVTFQSEDFMKAQLWLIHKLKEPTWEAFVAAHRGDYGEIAFHRVGAYYDRIGTLARLGLVDAKEILSTVGGHAIAVWQKIEPLVREARRIENSALFNDFEALLPACYECYVPSLGPGRADVHPFHVDSGTHKVSVQELKRRLDGAAPVTVLDVRQPAAYAADPRTLPGARVIPPDTVPQRLDEIPRDRDVVAYCA